MGLNFSPTVFGIRRYRLSEANGSFSKLELCYLLKRFYRYGIAGTTVDITLE